MEETCGVLGDGVVNLEKDIREAEKICEFDSDAMREVVGQGSFVP